MGCEKEYYKFFHYTIRLLKANVMDDVIVELYKQKSANSRFMFTRSLLRKHKILASTLDDGFEYDHPSTSTNLRQSGNALFKAELYEEAADMYTKSLKGSKPSTECYALAMANRSAAHFCMGKYDHCLRDARCAMATNYPSKLAYKLYERAGHAERKLGLVERAKESYAVCLTRLDEADMSAENKRKFRVAVEIAVTECEQVLTEQERAMKIPIIEHLVGGRNDNIPALSAFVELKMSEDMRRGVYATRDINPGDVVAIDEPYICGPSGNDTEVCHYNGCLKMDFALFRCPKCFMVYYCTKDCMDKDYKEGHNFACPIIYFIRSRIPGISRMNELAMKWFLKDYLKMGLKKYCSIVDNFSESKIDHITRGFDEIGQYKSDNFLTAYSLDNRENKMPMEVLFFFNCIAVDMLHYLILSGFKIPEQYMGSVGASLVHILTVLDLNCRKLNTNAPTVSFRSDTYTIALTLYPTISLFNHSCDANIKRSGERIDRIRVMKAIQPIPKGTQLCCSYGIIFNGHDTESRQEVCNDRFNFKCYSQPCIKNLPTFHFIPKHHSTLTYILNPSMADIVSSECKKFVEFTKSVEPKDHCQHLNYLYSFIKLLYTNVKRPFALYEECLEMIGNAHSISTNVIRACED
ncbi:SET and MYND domain-containing protein 4-like [Acyrthosiphon pisum]|uniref:SET and MYND domain-containing protein 4 n=1 Tax=Acyrthosiphon pisum TaxID=7029 RepID=A0A8R2JMX7_ACYPI|nr:SET and MYND domain-containing protein 4-like [Acyrthosiphon pisum]|eukprot:XP_003240210.1 PREDICTED: SET and MYND domain-containing protein 4-like [Acyrthosiphon pisum]